MENTTNQKKTFFYGWIIVAACMLIQAIPYSIAANIKPQFIRFVTEGEGFTLTEFSMIFTLGTFASAIASPFIGKIYSKPNLNIKLFYALGAILAGGSFMAFSYAGDNIWFYYALFGFVQIGVSIISAIGVPTLINTWFKVNKGLAMGLAFSGGGIGNIFLQQLAANMLNNPEIGYKGAYLVFGAMSMGVGLLVALFLVRFPKSDAELAANVPKKKEGVEAKTEAKWGYSFAEAKEMKIFWLFAVSFLFVGLYVGSMSVQFSNYFYAVGFDKQFVGNVGSVFAFVTIFGNLCGGMFFDKLGIRTSLIFAGITVIGCGLSLIFAPQIPALAFVFAVGLGISMFAYVIGPSYLVGALFGDKEFGTILGIVQIFFAVGFAAGSSIFGIIVDAMGYTVGWTSTTIFAAIAYVSLLISTGKIGKHNKDNNVTETKKIA